MLITLISEIESGENKTRPQKGLYAFCVRLFVIFEKLYKFVGFY